MMTNLIDIINKNNLHYLTFEELSKEITSKAKIDMPTVKRELGELIENGDLMYDSHSQLFVSSNRGYKKCVLHANKKGFAFAELIENPNNLPDIFIPAQSLMNALDGDIVLIEITSESNEFASEGRVVKIISHTNEYIVGTFNVSRAKSYVEPDDDKFPEIKITKADSLGAVSGDKVVARIIFNHDNKILHGVITEVLGKAGEVKAEELSIIRSYHLRETFDDGVLAEAKNISQTVSNKDKKYRMDFTSLRTITIDGEDSRDFDDAISVEKLEKGFLVGVHIADVSHYVKEGSKIDKEAFLRGNSVYFPDLVIPMLPESLSNGICSLREGVERLTLSVMIELDKNCKIVKSNIYNAVIKSNHRMTYTKVQKMLDGDKATLKEYQDIAEDIQNYSYIHNKLKAQRYARGEIRLDIPEPVVQEDENGEIVSITKQPDDEAHQLIESLMILCNEVVAKTFFTKKAPFVYRVQEKPDSSKISKLLATLKALKIHADIDEKNPTTYEYQKVVEKLKNDDRKHTVDKIILRSMMKARYDEKCLGHFGIASTFYCHFTSPIRRYPDLTIHRIIKKYLKEENSKDLHLNYDDFVKKVSVQSSKTEKTADEAERAVDDYKKALYMHKHLGDVYEGTISSVMEYGVYVELDNTIEGLVRVENLPIDNYEYDSLAMTLIGKSHSYKIGDKLQVMVVNANPRLRRIDFDLANSVDDETKRMLKAKGELDIKDDLKNANKAKSKTTVKSKKSKSQKIEKPSKTLKSKQGKKPVWMHKKKNKKDYTMY